MAKYSFFAMVASAILMASCCDCTVKENKELADRILSDTLFNKVEAMAKENIKTGLNAGSGYNEVWIRDFNTMEALALDVLPTKDIEDVLVTFMLLQDKSGGILDGYVVKGGSDRSGELSLDDVKEYVCHKNTVETDQESSLILAVCRFVKKMDRKDFLHKDVNGMTVAQHLEAAMDYLLANRFDDGYGLIWGATTSDWGDVQPEAPLGVLLDEYSHRSIDIYDNALLISALNAYLELADEESVAKWTPVRDSLKENAMKYLWDSERNKFHPHLYLEGSPFPEDFDEEAIMYHGGTGIAMEAGLLDKEQIKKTNEMMLANVEAAGASSVGMTIYPAYPKGFFQNPILTEPYTYQNGGDWTWYGARYITRLAKAGFVKEAYEEVRPMMQRVVDNGDFHEWYTLDNKPAGSACFRGAAGVLYEVIVELRAWAEENK